MKSNSLSLLLQFAILVPAIGSGFMFAAPVQVNAKTWMCIYGEALNDPKCTTFAAICNAGDKNTGTSFPGGQTCEIPDKASSRDANKLRKYARPTPRNVRRLKSTSMPASARSVKAYHLSEPKSLLPAQLYPVRFSGGALINGTEEDFVPNE